MDATHRGPSGQHVWRLGQSHQTSDLAHHLFEVSRMAGHSALTNLHDDDPMKRVWSATAMGLAVESMIKHLVAKVSPLLLTTRWQSAVPLARAGQTALAVSDLRTIGAGDGLLILRALLDADPRLPSLDNVEAVMRVRNSALHMGVVEVDLLSSAARTMVHVVSALLVVGDRAEADFWVEDFYELVDQLRDEKSSEIAITLAGKIAQAESKLNELIASLGPNWAATRDAIDAARSARWDDEEDTGHDCPVCDATGLLRRYVTESELDFSGYSYPHEQPSGQRYAYPESFECFFCGLSLDADEIEIEGSFDDRIEEELPPDDRFQDALEDWVHSERMDYERERMVRDDLLREYEAFD